MHVNYINDIHVYETGKNKCDLVIVQLMMVPRVRNRIETACVGNRKLFIYQAQSGTSIIPYPDPRQFILSTPHSILRSKYLNV